MGRNIEGSEDSPLSYEEARRNRCESLLRTVLDFTLGTLWWVKESLWLEVLPDGYDRHSTREGHPGLSIRRFPVEDLYDQAPMLHGSSRGSGIKVRGLTPDEPERRTAFGPLLAPVPVHEVFDDDSAPRLRQNLYKPRVTSEERKALDGFLQKRNLAP